MNEGCITGRPSTFFIGRGVTKSVEIGTGGNIKFYGDACVEGTLWHSEIEQIKVMESIEIVLIWKVDQLPSRPWGYKSDGEKLTNICQTLKKSSPD